MSLSSLHQFISSTTAEPIMYNHRETRCEDWNRILNMYRFSVQEYSEAVGSLPGLSTARFSEAWLRAEIARKSCDSLRAELLDHEHQHSCVAA
jgi:hypothetical protein